MEPAVSNLVYYDADLFEDWGLTHYVEAFERQRQHVERRIAHEIPDTLVMTEHYPVYTVGVRRDALEHLLWKQEQLQARGIELVETNRGGDITYHGPGQLVAYPIIELSHNRDLHRYLRNLEQVLINAIGCLGLAAHRKEGKTGVWLHNHKLAAIGVAARRGVAYHGFALNVNTDLTAFQGIVPCGISPLEGQVSSLAKELGQILDLREVKAIVAKEFWTIFRPMHNRISSK